MGLFNKKIAITNLFPDAYVDIHSHILPGIDDGAKNLDTSIDLIRRMHTLFGMDKFRITPHVMGDIWENSSALILEKKEELQKELIAKGYKEIQISAAAEYLMDDNFSKLLEANDILTLKDNYILVEMSFFNHPINLEEILFQIQYKGYIPVLAHPERYQFYHQDFEQYQKLITAGCLLQLNLLSLTNHYGKEVTKIAQKLLKTGMYTFVGSDVHHKMHIKLMETLANQKTKQLLTPLFNNNQKVFSF